MKIIVNGYREKKKDENVQLFEYSYNNNALYSYVSIYVYTTCNLLGPLFFSCKSAQTKYYSDEYLFNCAFVLYFLGVPIVAY